MAGDGDVLIQNLRVGDIVYLFESHIYPQVDKDNVGFIESIEKNAFGYLTYNVEFADQRLSLCAHEIVLAELWTRPGRWENEWEKKRS